MLLCFDLMSYCRVDQFSCWMLGLFVVLKDLDSMLISLQTLFFFYLDSRSYASALDRGHDALMFAQYLDLDLIY